MKPKICLPPSPPTPWIPSSVGWLLFGGDAVASFALPAPVFPAFFCSPFPLGAQQGSLSPDSEQTKLHPSVEQGEESPIPISFLLFIFSLHEEVLMEPRAGFCFQADSFAMFCFASGGKVFGGGCESSLKGSLALPCSIPSIHAGTRCQEVPGWAVHSSGYLLTPSLPQDMGGFAVNPGQSRLCPPWRRQRAGIHTWARWAAAPPS